MSYEWDSDDDAGSSVCNSDTSGDEEDLNTRISPYWYRYRKTLESRGYQLDCVHDVKQYYEQRMSPESREDTAGYSRACAAGDDNSLCKDAGLSDNLFRGSRIRDKLKIIVKAVNLRSREYRIINFLTTSPQRDDPSNHCIPVLDTIPITEDSIGIIIMEEWDTNLLGDQPCCIRVFLGALQQCTDHLVFMHEHGIAHLDLSLRNIVTDSMGHYACIDYETSRRFLDEAPRIRQHRAQEVPPEFERGEVSDPFKVDVWALAVFFFQASQLAGYNIPALVALIKRMLHDDPDKRPSAKAVQIDFDIMVSSMFQSGHLDCSGTT